MDFSPWDIEETFRLHVAACLIAGVPPLSKRIPDPDEIPAAAKPVLKKLYASYYFGTMVDVSEVTDSPENPKERWLFGIAADPADVRIVWKPPQGAIRKVGKTLDLDSMILEYLKHAMATRQELHRWIAAMGINSAYSFAPVVTSSVGAEPDAQTRTPAPEKTLAPVVIASGAMLDPERRLIALRSLGGTAKYSRSEWKFTGISALVASERASGRKRSSEKTIRADLAEAAQAERDAKSAGFATGLGQR
jgi:hypothetical protein